MKQIKIGLRFRPYSRLPGTKALIPCTEMTACIYPTRIEMFGLSSSSKAILSLSLKGPIKNFTIMQDLERFSILVFGSSQDGFFRYRLFQEKDCLTLKVEKGSFNLVIEELHLMKSEVSGQIFLQPKDVCNFTVLEKAYIPLSMEVLSLGCSKAQDADLILRRKDLKEILPIWFRLGQVIQSNENSGGRDNFALLRQSETILLNKEKKQLPESLLSLYQSMFSGIFSPQSRDRLFLGLAPFEKTAAEENALALLNQSCSLIRRLFFECKNREIYILPFLPNELNSGRFLSIQTPLFSLDFEWSKGIIKRMVLRTKENVQAPFLFQKEIRNYRLRNGKKGIPCFYKNGDSVILEKNKEYFFDRFQK